MNKSIFKDLLNHNYPKLTTDNQTTILRISDVIQKGQTTNSERGSFSTPDWVVLSPHGTANNACMKSVMVMASDKSNRFPLKWNDAYSLNNALENLINYYQNCHKITKLGVLVTNVWSPSKLFSFSPQIEYFEARGIQSVVILISGNAVLPISWPWR